MQERDEGKRKESRRGVEKKVVIARVNNMSRLHR